MVQIATIIDVAQRAGCGVATVSRVLNNTGPASAQMIKRVLAAVDELDFQFSEVSSSLQRSATRTIGCVVPSIENPVYADAVQGAQEVFLAAGYQMLLTCTNYNSDIETDAIRTLIAKQVDGILLTVADVKNSDGLNLIRSRELPHSLLFNEAPEGEVSWSVGDHEAAALVAEAFAKNNHVHAGFLALNFLNSDRARQRYEGFVQGCARHNMSAPALLEVDDDGSLLLECSGGGTPVKVDIKEENTLSCCEPVEEVEACRVASCCSIPNLTPYVNSHIATLPFSSSAAKTEPLASKLTETTGDGSVSPSTTIKG